MRRFQGAHHVKTPLRAAAFLALLAIALVGCSSRQLHGAGQAWQRNECIKIPDQQERSRCLSSAAASYEQYQREAAAAKARQ
jgi:hypothetical protein